MAFFASEEASFVCIQPKTDLAERNPFLSARDLKAATGFPGQNDTIISRLRAAGLRPRHAAVKELLTDEHKIYRLASAESNVDRKWDRVIFTDESTFTLANDGPVLVYRPQGERYKPAVYVYLQTQWSCVCQLLGLDLP